MDNDDSSADLYGDLGESLVTSKNDHEELNVTDSNDVEMNLYLDLLKDEFDQRTLQLKISIENEKLERENTELKNLLKERDTEILELLKKNESLTLEKTNLWKSNCSLYKTAKNEIEQKNLLLKEANERIDKLLISHWQTDIQSTIVINSNAKAPSSHLETSLRELQGTKLNEKRQFDEVYEPEMEVNHIVRNRDINRGHERSTASNFSTNRKSLFSKSYESKTSPHYRLQREKYFGKSYLQRNSLHNRRYSNTDWDRGTKLGLGQSVGKHFKKDCGDESRHDKDTSFSEDYGKRNSVEEEKHFSKDNSKERRCGKNSPSEEMCSQQHTVQIKYKKSQPRKRNSESPLRKNTVKKRKDITHGD